MTTYVMGDIHGNYDGLIECLDRAGVNESDILISLGDVCDGYRKTKQAIDTLLKYNVILIAGNHDCSVNGTGRSDYGWALGWMLRGDELPLWVHQGGHMTMESYDFDYKSVPKSHIAFLLSGLPYYIVDKMCFVHGGIKEIGGLKSQKKEDLMWDRKMVHDAEIRPIIKRGIKQIFCGHTSTYAVGGQDKPLFRHNVVMMDTGSGWNGRLTIMDIHTKEYWQSEHSTIENDRPTTFEFSGKKIKLLMDAYDNM